MLYPHQLNFLFYLTDAKSSIDAINFITTLEKSTASLFALHIHFRLGFKVLMMLSKTHLLSKQLSIERNYINVTYIALLTFVLVDDLIVVVTTNSSEFIPEEHIGRLIVRVRTLLSQRLQHELSSHGVGITTQQWGLLSVLIEDDGISQTQLAERAFKDKPTTTRMLKLLEKKEFITRQRDAVDQRAYQVFLTPKGELVVQDAVCLAMKVMQEAQENLSEQEISEYKRITRIINKNLSE